LKILNILNSRNALKAESGPPSEINISAMLIITIKASNKLKLSAAYPLTPSPMSFRMTSKVKTIVKNRLISLKSLVVSLSTPGY
jgi:hypothetical protein